MDSLSLDIINRYQGGFPLSKRPFSAMAKEIGSEESTIIDSIRQLLSTGILTRFGPLYNAACLGGGLTLAAVSVPEKDYSTVTDQINSLAEVAHNYRRDHELNMWFVLATETPEGIDRSIRSIENITGLKVYNFPKLQEYYLGLWLWLDKTGFVSTRSFDVSIQQDGYILDDLDRRIIQTTQEGLPLTPEPFEYIAEQIPIDVSTLINRMERMLDYGVIRRIGVIPNHYRLGLSSNGMSVWNVPDDCVNQLGEVIGRFDFVSHCYQRPRHTEVWPYNLFAMVHGHTRDEVMDKVALISDRLGEDCLQSDVLFSSAILKKSGLRLVA